MNDLAGANLSPKRFSFYARVFPDPRRGKQASKSGVLLHGNNSVDQLIKHNTHIRTYVQTLSVSSRFY